MNKSKRLFLFMISLAAVSLFGCRKENKKAGEKNERQLTVLCTVFPLYDWGKSILGGDSNDRFRLELMMKKGTDLHNFQPSVADLAKLNSADILFYIGGESDEWIEDALSSSKNKSQMRFSFMNLMKEAAGKENSEGINLFEEDDFGEEDSEEDHDETEYDEHIWLSLKNASFGIQLFGDIFQKLDPEMAGNYQNRKALYLEDLNKLDNDFKTVLSGRPALLFADRFPFRYFTEDYGLPYYAAFPGCSAETEASFSTVIFLSERVKELGLDTIYILENSSTKLADQIIQTSGADAKIRVLNSMQNINDSDIKNGITYLKLMEKNLEVLRGND